MKLHLIREPSTELSTIGSLYVNDSMMQQCFTLEDPVREIPGQPVEVWKIAKQTAIPVGTYQVIINMSNRFKRRMPLLVGVPGFDGIRIHGGNTAEDTDACILVGRKRTDDTIIESQLALADVYLILETALLGGERVEINVR